MASLLERLREVLAPKYTVERTIASGGMGIVFLGRNTRLQSRVAIKVLKPELATPDMEASFGREARLLAKLNHPNIVTIHDVDVADGIFYYVMEFIDGETVADRIKRWNFDPTTVGGVCPMITSRSALALSNGASSTKVSLLLSWPATEVRVAGISAARLHRERRSGLLRSLRAL